MIAARLVASGFGCGRFPWAPGSVASAITLLAAWPLMQVSQFALPAAALLASLGGLWAIQAARVEGDPGWVVIDEIAGQFLALLGLAQPTLTGFCAGFLVFRLLDVVKPGPIGWADRQGGAAGIMADDVIAGIIAAGILWAARSQWPMAFD